MGTKTFASYAKSWHFKVCVQLVVCGACIFESITPPSATASTACSM